MVLSTSRSTIASSTSSSPIGTVCWKLKSTYIFQLMVEFLCGGITRKMMWILFVYLAVWQFLFDGMLSIIVWFPFDFVCMAPWLRLTFAICVWDGPINYSKTSRAWVTTSKQ
jgi:hypothetical protein